VVSLVSGQWSVWSVWSVVSVVIVVSVVSGLTLIDIACFNVCRLSE